MTKFLGALVATLALSAVASQAFALNPQPLPPRVMPVHQGVQAPSHLGDGSVHFLK